MRRVLIVCASVSLSGCILIPYRASQEPAWLHYDPPGAVNRDIRTDIFSRLPVAYQNAASEEDGVGEAHEGTHYLNSFLRQHGPKGCNAAYVGQGRFVLLREPDVTIEEVLRYVPLGIDSRGVMSTWEQWNTQPLYILDELSAYINGSQAALEQSAPEGRTTGSLARAGTCSIIADALVRAIEDLDPTYPQLDELRRFVSWQHERLSRLSQRPAQSPKPASKFAISRRRNSRPWDRRVGVWHLPSGV